MKAEHCRPWKLYQQHPYVSHNDDVYNEMAIDSSMHCVHTQHVHIHTQCHNKLVFLLPENSAPLGPTLEGSTTPSNTPAGISWPSFICTVAVVVGT